MREELAYVRADPGRSIGTSTSPPPERTPSDPNQPTLVGSMRQHDDARAVSSASNAAKKDDRSGDLGMSLTSYPGDLFRRRPRWLVPAFLVLGCLGLIGGGLGAAALGAQHRTAATRPAPSGAGDSAADLPRTPAPSLPVDPPAAAAAAAPSAPATTMTAAVTTTTTTAAATTAARAPSGPTAIAPPRAATQPPPAAAGAARKSAPAASTGPRKDLYRPF
jgi:hypothetical protein